MNTNAEYLPKNDPIMQELWAIKALINREADYSVEEIVRRMREKYPLDPAVSLQSNEHSIVNNSSKTRDRKD